MEWWKTFFSPENYGPTLDEFPAERTRAEVDFVLSLLQPRTRDTILDLCCGVGRHAVEIARRGYKVVGLDYNAHYLDAARERARTEGAKVEFLRADMRKIPAGRQFDAVINLFTSFGYFEKDTDNFKTLTAVARCLKPGGRFVLDTANRDSLIKNFIERDWSEENGGFCLEQRHFDVRNNLHVSHWIWIRDGKITEGESRLKLYPFSVLKQELARRGMRILDVFGGFDGIAFDPDARRMILLAEKNR